MPVGNEGHWLIIKLVSLVQHNSIYMGQIHMGNDRYLFDETIMKYSESKSTIISEPSNSENFQVELTSLGYRFHKVGFTVTLP